jgi:hypothetical protein
VNRRRPRFAEKRTLYRRALEGSERVLGKEDPQTLTCLNNLAGCMRALGDAAGALPLYRRALESRERPHLSGSRPRDRRFHVEHCSH